jgi:hypothetical protein
MKYNCAKDEMGNPVKGTGARHIVITIIRIRTMKGEYRVSDGLLESCDHNGNKLVTKNRHPEEWFETFFEFTRGYSESGQIMTQCTDPKGGQTVYEMPFNIENVSKLPKLAESNKI